MKCPEALLSRMMSSLVFIPSLSAFCAVLPVALLQNPVDANPRCFHVGHNRVQPWRCCSGCLCCCWLVSAGMSLWVRTAQRGSALESCRRSGSALELGPAAASASQPSCAACRPCPHACSAGPGNTSCASSATHPPFCDLQHSFGARAHGLRIPG